MSKVCKTNKRRKHNISRLLNRTKSRSFTSDFEFLTGPINVQDPFLWILLSGRVMHHSFWNLFEKSDENERRQLLIDERSRLKLDDKAKPKRFVINRLIHAYAENNNHMNQQISQLIESIQNQLSDTIPCEPMFYTPSQLYGTVQAWRQIQCRRRLFFEECVQPCNLLTLQRLMTDQFLNVMHSFQQNSHSFQEQILLELFQHSLLIVVQPCGTDCIAATKYEKEANNFVAKLKTRILCLLDPIRTQEYLTLSNTEMTLQREGDEADGDLQAALVYKTRTIMTKENTERIFGYYELKETECLKLTKLNDNGKPSFNKMLCKLRFQTVFRVKINEIFYAYPVIYTSKLFGLCSHAKYYPKYLAKVFLNEVEEMHRHINPTFHANILKEYIAKFYKRVTGVDIKLHTLSFLVDQMHRFYELCEKRAASPTAPVLIVSLNIYEDFMANLFSQIRFLDNQPCLALMYHDNLCRGITSEIYDKELEKTESTSTKILIRFENFTLQDPKNYPDFIVVKFDDTLSTSRISFEYLLNDICRYCDEITDNSLQIFAEDQLLPFSTFNLYYDSGLSRSHLMQSNNNSIFHSANILTPNTASDQSPISDEQNASSTCYFTGEFNGNFTSVTQAMTDLRRYVTDLCEKYQISGTVAPSAIKPYTDELDILRDTFFLSDDDIGLFGEHDCSDHL
ncbi:unnamed protein product [Adineta ricciae]|uniref:Uncharacterized protein n=1 Tax=Adineta ricciae TaxID=249248 RepID=A0A814K6Z9_ADIRI|nr:unnamed protein product [Adineta ricciae]